jgi:hypothetical protein
MEKLIRWQVKLTKLFLVLFLLLILPGPSLAAEWARIYEGIGTANSIQQTSDGGFIVAAGGFSPYSFFSVFAIVKLNGEGFIEWQKGFGRGGATSIQVTSDGGSIVTGWVGWVSENISTSEVVPMSPPPLPTDILVLKLSGDGSIAWQKTYNLSWTDKANSIEQTSDGGYILLGEGSGQGWIFKLDSGGNVQWQKTYGPGTFYSIQQTSDGGYIAAGSTGAGKNDAWVMKLDGNGNIQGQKTFGGPENDGASSVQQTSDGGYIVAGQTESFGAGSIDAWIFKLDGIGNVQWQKTYGGSGEDIISSIRQTKDGGYIAAGLTNSFGAGEGDAWVVKLDKDGNIGWQKTLRYGGGARSVLQTLEGDYIAAGSVIMKLDSEGNVPGCAIVGDSNAAVNDTDVVGQDANVTGTETDIIPQIGNVTLLIGFRDPH